MGSYAQLGPAGSMPSGKEIRGSGARVGSDFPVDLYVAELPGALPARARDVGVGGICIATASPFALKSVRRVVIRLADRTLTLDAEGRWQFDGSSDGLVLSGLEFVDAPQDAIEALSDVVLESGRVLARFLFAHSELRDFGLEGALGLAQITRFRDVSAGRFIYRQETSAPREDSILIVVTGTVVLTARARATREVTLAKLEPGQVFGGMPLVGDLPHPESAVAETDCRLLELDRDAFRYLETAHPWLAQKLAFAVAKTYTRRLYGILSRVRDLL